MRPSPSPHPLVVGPLPGPLTLDFVRSLRHRRARDQTGLFVAEGVRFLTAAWDNAVSFSGIVICPSLLHGPVPWQMVESMRSFGVPCLHVSPDEFRALTLGRSN